MRLRQTFAGIVLVLGTLAISATAQQAPPAGAPPAGAPAGGRGPAAGGGGGGAYPQRPPADPYVLERGKALYGVNCQFCHGSDARGGEGGPNLIRSEVLLLDQNGEKLTPVVQRGFPDRGMPAVQLSAAQISDIAAFIHSFRVGGYDVSRMRPENIVVGDAKAGEAYFKAKCQSCHSVTGNLQGVGAKYADPKALQNTLVMPGGRGGRGSVPPTTVTVTVGGQKTEGRLVRIDDFLVTLAQADNTQRTFRRNGDVPKVEIHDPLQGHKDLLRVHTDKDIHDLTAYLVTLK